MLNADSSTLKNPSEAHEPDRADDAEARRLLLDSSTTSMMVDRRGGERAPQLLDQVVRLARLAGERREREGEEEERYEREERKYAIIAARWVARSRPSL